ncbi:DNA-binding transcriptional LysR family regulator [Bradyrhizobium sp. cir1]|uniref:LysR family transcriptional regulator n=1 Tax=Bradyrhizobium sp. cir1 TaxID=1445730 RepID=UPI0016061165|nr:LysR family transcriptional regulator [Bradyrhizobium sp. cir1]MBB4368362.1 DNA-binding transcriptional LysR family regulator [Bradyrhizobium sp. cir1]
MELRHLRYFTAVAGERSFTRAAEKLRIAQPPLSRQMRDLEEELGVALFERGSRPLRLTPAGRFFHEHALQILERADELRITTRRFGEAGRRQLIIGFVGSALYGGLPDVVRGFRAAHSRLEVGLIEMNTVEQIAALKEGRIDVGFGRLRFDDPAIRREVIVEESLLVALSPDHPLRERETLRFVDIAAEPLVLYPRSPRPSYADQILSFFRDRSMEAQVVQEVRELQTALGLVAAGVGISLVPQSVQHLRRHDVLYRPLAEDSITSPLIMSFRASDTSPEVREILEVIRAIYNTSRSIVSSPAN